MSSEQQQHGHPNAINTTTNDADTNNTNATTISEPHPERYPVGCSSPDTKLLPGHPGRVHTINTTTNDVNTNNITNVTTISELHPERHPVGCASPDTKLLPGHPERVHIDNETTVTSNAGKITTATPSTQQANANLATIWQMANPTQTT